MSLKGLNKMAKWTIRVPATTANIGPGFDTLGCALNVYNDITFDDEASELVITGCPAIYQNVENLTYQAYCLVYEACQLPCPAIRIAIEAAIPVERGLGSSAAMIVAGAYGANCRLGYPLTETQLLTLCLKLENHPDNLASCLYGGLNASLIHDGHVYNVRYPIAEAIQLYAFIPNFSINTHLARQVLPTQLSRDDVVFNLSHLAVLLKALENDDEHLIRQALDDRLHQPYRQKLIKQYDQLAASAFAHGAYGFFISGSGPTCIAFSHHGSFRCEMQKELDKFRDQWQVMSIKVDLDGARKVN